jgi:hypothetical protein
MSGIRLTAVNLVTKIKEVMESLQISMNQFLAVCTDSPSAMVKMRRDLSKEFTHMVDLQYIAHAFNLIAKG